MSDDFTAGRFRWLEVLAGDPRLPGASRRIAIIICTKYLSRRNGAAWPGIETLALDLHMTARGVKKARDALVNLGYLTVVRGGGFRKTNVYRIAFPDLANSEPAFTVLKQTTVNQRSPFNGEKAPETVNWRSGKGEQTGQTTVNCSSPEPLERTLRRNPLNKTVHRPQGVASENVILKNPKAFIERLYREAPEKAVGMLVEFGEESRFEAAALKAYNKVRFDEDGFFARMQTLNVEERSLTEIFSFLNGEHIKLLPGNGAAANGKSFSSDFEKLWERYPNGAGKPAEAKEAFRELVTEFPCWQTDLVEAFADDEYWNKVAKRGMSLTLFLRRFHEQQKGA